LKANPKSLFIDHRTILVLHKLQHTNNTISEEKKTQIQLELETEPKKKLSEPPLVDYMCQVSRLISILVD